MRATHQSVNKSKKEHQTERQFAKGGKTHMFKKQSAGTDRPGNTGKDQTPAPGARSARGGSAHMAGFTPARTAKPGRTGPDNVPKKGR